MKFAFSTLGCPRWTVEQVADNAVRMGYSGIELRLLDGKIIDPVSDVEKVRQAASIFHSRRTRNCTTTAYNMVA